MPDRRTHRGPHPDDARLFHPDRWATLQAATADLSWLFTRGYAWKSALKIVGDRHALTARQRMAVWRSACSHASLASRRDRMRSVEAIRASLPGESPVNSKPPLAIDAYNVLITVESALAGGVVLAGQDGCYRDLSSVHGTYRKVEETLPAITLVGEVLESAGVNSTAWYIDRPVSNSGRLRGFIEQIAGDRGWNWRVHLVHNPDCCLVEAGAIVASTDSWVLDHCGGWLNLARLVIESRIPDARIVPLMLPGPIGR